MKRPAVVTYEFVKNIPDELEDFTLYISMDYATAVHACCCGCGKEVVTPLSPTDWKLIYDGVSISLYPSIGNWSFKCQSHYWISNNKVRWAGRWSESRIDAERLNDQRQKMRYFGRNKIGGQLIGNPIRKVSVNRVWRLICSMWRS